MKKKNVIIVLLVVAFLSAGYFAVRSRDKENVPSAQTEIIDEAPPVTNFEPLDTQGSAAATE